MSGNGKISSDRSNGKSQTQDKMAQGSNSFGITVKKDYKQGHRRKEKAECIDKPGGDYK